MGEKLDEFARTLSDDEQMALATAFGLAGRGLGTFWGSQACIRPFMVALKAGSICVARGAGGSVPRLSESFENAFCPGSAGRFSIEGLEVDKTVTGAKSVAAGAKSVAAGMCRFPGSMGAKSVAAGFCRNPGFAGANSVAAAACRMPGFAGAKSVAAAGAKSVAAARMPGFAGAKSVAAAACRMPGLMGAKSVAAAACRPWQFGGYCR
jgi:hypothetical protein